MQSFFFDFLSSDSHHSFADVCTDDVLWLDAFGKQQCKIAGSCCNVEDLLRFVFAKSINGSAPPTPVYAKRQSMVQPVVGRRNLVEHALYLLLFTAFSIGSDRFLLIHLLFV